MGNPVIPYQRGVRVAVSVSWQLGGHPWFIHYLLRSCSNSVWDLKHDGAFLHLGEGVGFILMRFVFV